MCEQTEINYLDGDIVWVKLGAYWWPGQVTGFDNLPDDIKGEFQKKPLIAAVKFFQEDTYEYVKNYQQIYKYNCTLKDEFIKKGLDKYRRGDSYMNKFPGDVEMAEKLTGGDPDILNSEKFSPEEKPDISALFGEKKIPKKKKDRDDLRRSDGADVLRKITHPRFLRESDHEVRIRQQPSSLPSTPNNTASPQYPCHMCNFTSSRVNVIICHIKSHRSGGSPAERSRVRTYTQPRSRILDAETPKRKYIRKEKSHSNKSKTESGLEIGKRKQPKQIEKANKKKKTDPEIREKLLADWDDESDEDISFDQNKSLNSDLLDVSSVHDESADNKLDEQLQDTSTDDVENNDILAESEKLLKETEKLSTIHMMDDSITSRNCDSKSMDVDMEKSDFEKTSKSPAKSESVSKSQWQKENLNSDGESKGTGDDKKSRLSCFDFDEDDLPEPSIPPVRKIPRVFGEKNLSLKKEIIKEFEMSQALKIEQDKDIENDKQCESKTESTVDVKSSKSVKSSTGEVNEETQEPDNKIEDKITEKEVIANKNEVTKVESKAETGDLLINDNQQKSSGTVCETELEIVEIFEVEREDGDDECIETTTKTIIEQAKIIDEKVNESEPKDAKDDEGKSVLSKVVEKGEAPTQDIAKNKLITEFNEDITAQDTDEALSEKLTTETEDETVSESADTLQEQSEISDIDQADLMNTARNPNALPESGSSVTTEKIVRKRRGRPRKNESTDSSRSGSQVENARDKRLSMIEKMDIDRKTSESDTERSYSGRKRKPNKKYLQSDIYVHDTDQKAFKTDESMSENEEKIPEIPKNKRRGRRSSKFHKSLESSNKLKDQEIELSDKLLRTAKDDVKSDSKEKVTGEPEEGKKVVGLEEKLTETKDDSSFQDKTETAMEIAEEVNQNNIQTVTKSPIITETSEKLPESQSSQITKKGEIDESKNKIIIPNDQQEKLSLSSVTIQESSDDMEAQKISVSKSSREMLPPKKSQIKKFEQSKTEFFDDDTSSAKSVAESEPEKKIDKGAGTSFDRFRVESNEGIEESFMEEPGEAENATAEKINLTTVTKEMIVHTIIGDSLITPSEILSQEDLGKEKKEEELPEKETLESKKEEKADEITDESLKQARDGSPTKIAMQTRYKGKFTPETGNKGKKEKDAEEKPVNTFQEAFLKTLQMDKKKGTDDTEALGKGKKGKKPIKKPGEESDNTSTVVSVVSIDQKDENLHDNSSVKDITSATPSASNNSEATAVGGLEGMEIDLQETVEIQIKQTDSVVQSVDQSAVSSVDTGTTTKQDAKLPKTEEDVKTFSLDLPKTDEPKNVSVPSPTSEVTVPVKKREMPRIIENVTLTEPMQILKTKLLDKLPVKSTKHKLESDAAKKGGSRAKIMKIEPTTSNSKMKTGMKVTAPHMSLSKKLQVLKAEESEITSNVESQKDTLNIQGKQTVAVRPIIQQSSQSLSEMELDINSMPFVLSEDVLTPESIEQMPVVISSIIPSSTSLPSTMSFTPTTQIITTNQTQFKLANENPPDVSPKKKSGTPAILKNKSRAKPTITSIKTLVPPLTGGVKGLKFQNTQPGKAQPVLTQKSAPGKYVVVQASGGQQLRYSVQGKPGTTQKIAIPAGKSAGNAQVVQQGGKVVILTSAQSGQTKMLPLNISKALSSKVQKIVTTTKPQIFCPISPQNIISSKAIIASKGDPGSSTTSKLPPGHKIINTHGIITSKGVLTPIPGAIGKPTILGLPHGILTKGGIYTPISAASLGTKAIIGSKTLVTKGTTVLSSQNLGTSKAIFTPITQTLTAKTILSSQSIVGPRGTVLTPITGQQVKAIAAKSPSKSTKVQYQPVQQKIQLPVLQKNQKVPMGSSSQGRIAGALKSPTGTLVLQNTAQKGSQFGKKIVKQTIVQQCGTVQSASPHTSAQQTATSSSPRIQQKGRSQSVSGVQKVIVPRGGGRQTKAQQKIVVQKIQEPIVTAAQNIQLKQTVGSATTMPAITKTFTQQKHNVTSTATVGKGSMKTHVVNKTAVQQKNVLNVALNSATATTNVSLTAPLSLPPLEPIEREKVTKIEETPEGSMHKEQPATTTLTVDKGGEVAKVIEPKVTSQPQIMALPTESTDGTQTYVLVTIDEQGQIQPLDNNTLMSLEGTTQNPDGTRTLYIDPSSLGEAGTLDNIVLQFDNGALPNVQNNVVTEASQAISESFPTSEIVQTSNQDILAAALANTDFQQEINLPENPTANVMTTGLTQTSLINQTILQSTIIPPTEPISSPSVLETSLTLNQPIMTPLEVPSNLPIQAETTPTSVVSTIPSSLELPITITNPSISYIATGEAQIQIPGNSMPDIGEIMENPTTVEISQANMPASTQYLVIPNLDENITVEAQGVQNNAIDMPSVSYSVSIPSEIALQPTQAQTTPSMPIIDDTYTEDTQFATSVPSAIVTEQSFIDVPVSEMLVSKASDVTPSQDVTVTSETTESSQEIPVSIEENKVETTIEKEKEEVTPLKDTIVSEDTPVTTVELNDQQPTVTENSTENELTVSSGTDKDQKSMEIVETTEQTSQSNSMPIIDESTSGTSESNIQAQPAEQMSFEVTDSSTTDSGTRQEADTVCELNRLISTEQVEDKLPSPAPTEQVQTSNQSDATQEQQERQEELPGPSTDVVQQENMEVEEGVESAIYTAATVERPDDVQTNEPSSEVESDQQRIHGNVELHMEETNTETTSQETPSQSYEQFDVSMTSDSADLPSQSATKSENSREPSQSIAYEPMETDEDAVSAEPPTQSFEHSKRNEASQSYEAGSAETSTNAPTQSFNEIAQSQDGSSNVDEAIDDQSFPTQSYDVGKLENLPENLETDAEISQEGNIPSQSNDVGTDGIGTSSVSTNNSGLNEDETASSSYVPETPENQERDQDQESAISTSSYEIPPCEELNIASSSVIPDTSVSAEHTSIHDNGIPEIPTSSYNLNPDITSTHVDSVPTSSYEEHVLVEQNVSTSYDVPISMPGLEETSSQNFVTESTDHRDEPSSYYAHHQEVTASYYEPVDQETNSRLERDAQEEVTPSYYERNSQEASQSYFAPEEATPSYTEHSVSPSYYDHGRPESEASQSCYPADDLEKTDQSPSQNIEASQSFYQEQTDDLRLRQQGEATPTYSERYPVDYTLENSPIERHDLVESSVPATRPTER